MKTTPTCHTCGHQFDDCEPGWVEDVKVIEPDGIKAVTRYTCDTCEAKR